MGGVEYNEDKDHAVVIFYSRWLNTPRKVYLGALDPTTLEFIEFYVTHDEHKRVFETYKQEVNGELRFIIGMKSWTGDVYEGVHLGQITEIDSDYVHLNTMRFGCPKEC